MRPWIRWGVAGLLAMGLAATVQADGDETLGPPSVAIATGSGVATGGTGLAASGTGSINLTLPLGVTVQQVLLYWFDTDTGAPADSVFLEGGLVIGEFITSGAVNGTWAFRADITGLNLVSAGANSLSVSTIGGGATQGASIVVIYDTGGADQDIQVLDGNDLLDADLSSPSDTAVAQTFTFPAAAVERTAGLSFIASLQEGTDHTLEIDGMPLANMNPLLTNVGANWTSANFVVTVPAGATSLTVQPVSTAGSDAAQIYWLAVVMRLPPPPPPEVEICVLATVNPDMVSNFSDADNIVGDGCDISAQAIPVGGVNQVDGTYRLRVTNTGAEALTNVRINAPDFGLVDQPIPCGGGNLTAGEACLINFGDPGFSSLKMLNLCVAPGMVNKIASVDAEGLSSGIPASDDDPAQVDCVANAAATLRKLVQLSGGPLVDANAPEMGPVGSLGTGAEYRLLVENPGTDPLINGTITDASLGLTDVPVPGGPITSGEIRTITHTDAGFANLLVSNRCVSTGTFLNIASLAIEGQTTGATLTDDDPAYVTCEDPMVELLKQVSLDGINVFDADNPGDPDVPVGLVGLTDATYRLIVRNIGTETLQNVQIEDATLGISTFVADLAPGETRVLQPTDTGFGNLFQPMRCGGTPGNKSNIASVTAKGSQSGTSVGDNDAANVRCIIGPAIELLKQVSVDGVNFFDADTQATGPQGSLGADATYRLILRNVGDEDLTNVLVTDTTLGINSEAVPDLPIGGETVIDVGSFGRFSELFFPNRCDSTGSKLNIAEVSANGASTGTPVQDDNPAWLNCSVPAICGDPNANPATEGGFYLWQGNCGASGDLELYLQAVGGGQFGIFPATVTSDQPFTAVGMDLEPNDLLVTIPGGFRIDFRVGGAGTDTAKLTIPQGANTCLDVEGVFVGANRVVVNGRVSLPDLGPCDDPPPPDDVQCGAPQFTMPGFYAWQTNCDTPSEPASWQFVAASAGGPFTIYTGELTSTAGLNPSSFLLEPSDTFLELPNQVDFSFRVAGNGQDGFSAEVQMGAEACLDVGPVKVGALGTEFAGPLNLVDPTQPCAAPPPQCGPPDSFAVPGLYVWENCAAGTPGATWVGRLIGGPAFGRYVATVFAEDDFVSVTESDLESNDVVDVVGGDRLELDLKVKAPGEDGFSFELQPGTTGCFDGNTIPGNALFAGANAVQVFDSFELNPTLAGCD